MLTMTELIQIAIFAPIPIGIYLALRKTKARYAIVGVVLSFSAGLWSASEPTSGFATVFYTDAQVQKFQHKEAQIEEFLLKNTDALFYITIGAAISDNTCEPIQTEKNVIDCESKIQLDSTHMTIEEAKALITSYFNGMNGLTLTSIDHTKDSLLIKFTKSVPFLPSGTNFEQ